MLKTIKDAIGKIIVELLIVICTAVGSILWAFNSVQASQETEIRTLKESLALLRGDIKEVGKENSKEHREILEKIYELKNAK